MVGSNLQNNWSITALLSDSGGNAQLWQGESQNGTIAAIKIPRDIQDPVRNEKRHKRFRKEIEMMLLVQRLGINSVMPIIDHGINPDGKPWCAMPIGTPVYLSSSFTSRMELVAQLSDVVANLHRNGIEHLDIKLSNLLIVDGEMRLSDFGHAKIMGVDQLAATSVATDNSNLHAEKIPSDPDRPWFDYDMYSLGKACWQILAGLKPKSLTELSSPEDDLEPHWPHIDASIIEKLQELIFSATRRNPQDRPNAMQFHQAIQRVMRLVT